MNKLYLCAFQTAIDREKLTKLLDKTLGIENWFYSLPYSIFIKTGLSPMQLSQTIEAEFGTVIHFIVEVADHYGRLPKEHWNYF